ncbi:hypothetical protein [Microbacterium oleivorans]|uniref:Uncharacterized protein n=1 Tax=Microbacterium oleivorans TaxID=273677 RepID=A0A7D5EW72_9MICO|nr:hypothetical protein [Microbacterium oleivorans]QLD10710.1 hypothetical protein HW566_02290 [Microbacterium oleivorans]
MSDVARFLPLSQRTADGPADILDRRAQLAGIVDLVATALADTAAPEAEIGVEAFLRDAGLTSAVPDGGTADLGSLSASLRSGGRRTAKQVVAAARAYLRLPVADRPPLPAAIAGAVAFAASSSATSDRRAAIAGHTVRASDAAWSFGRGPDLIATGDEIVAFLTGVSDQPPRRPRFS